MKQKRIMKRLFWIINIISFFLISCGNDSIVKLSNNLDNYQVGKIKLRKEACEKTIKSINNEVISNLKNIEKISGPVKGIKIEILLYSAYDTLQIFSFYGGKYIVVGKDYYKLKMDKLLPDFVINEIK
jgi:hypothetical protein